MATAAEPEMTTVSFPLTSHPAPQPLRPGPASPRKEEILDGLESIVRAEGFRSLRLTDVAKRLGTSYTTLYQLAPTKDELVLLVIDRWYHRNGLATWARVEALTDPLERLLAWIDGARSGIEGVAGRFWDDVAGHAAVAALVGNYNRFYISVLEMLIDEGIQAGAFRPVNAQMAAMVFEAAGARLYDPDARVTDASVGGDPAAGFIDLMLGGLLARD